MSKHPIPSVAGPQIRFVLVRTSHPGNIGSAARAIRTMGFDRLALVAPHKFPHPDAVALASGAVGVLEDAAVSPSLVEAVSDCTLVLGCTARARAVQLEELSPREAARRALAASASGAVALVFGNERTGLENDELMSCHAAVRIPSVEDFPSLNLAQAVQVLAYELRLATMESVPPTRNDPDEPQATSAQLEHMFTHLAQMLDDIDFHKGRSPVTIMKRLRRLFLHANLDQREVRILRGIFDDAQRMARLAKARD
ncbi:MAG: RNA methyltransferase [Proteobacteria bacterium]|nr:RNA methyltransferase [Pseudomonadota bacterium]